MTTKDHYEHGQFAWVDLVSHDMTAAARFYGSLFGWSAARQDTQGGPPYAEFRLEGRTVAGLGEMNQQMKDQGIPPMWNSYIGVDDVDGVLARAEKLGATVAVPAMDVLDAGRLAFLSDPTGGQLGLWQAKRHKGAQVVCEPGSFCWNELATRDTDRAAAFFGELLGWEFTQSERAPTKYLIASNRGQQVAGLIQMTEEWGDIPPHWMVYFQVRDVDASARAAGEGGGKVCVPPFDIPVGRISVVNDPQGAVFTLMTVAEPGS